MKNVAIILAMEQLISNKIALKKYISYNFFFSGSANYNLS